MTPGEGEAAIHWRPPPGGVRAPVWWFGRLLLGALAPRLLGFRVAGRAHVPDRGGVLVIVNHPADIDPAAIGLACVPRPALYMAAARHFRGWPLATLLFSLGAFPIRSGRPDLRAMRHARDQLTAGRLVVVFPEGGASGDGRLRTFHEGAGHLALTPGVTVIPVAIWGSQRVLRGWRPVGRGPIRIAFGEPLAVPSAGSPRARAAEVTRSVRAAIEGLLDPMIRERP